MNEAYFLQTLTGLNARSNEIYFHPALHDPYPQIQRRTTSGGVEFNALTSPKIERLKQLASNGSVTLS